MRIKLKYTGEFNQNRLRVAETDNRDQIRDSLLRRQIASAIFYPIPLHRQKAFANSDSMTLTTTDSVSRRCLSLPIFSEMSEHQIETVCDAVLDA